MENRVLWLVEQELREKLWEHQPLADAAAGAYTIRLMVDSLSAVWCFFPRQRFSKGKGRTPSPSSAMPRCLCSAAEVQAGIIFWLFLLADAVPTCRGTSFTLAAIRAAPRSEFLQQHLSRSTKSRSRLHLASRSLKKTKRFSRKIQRNAWFCPRYCRTKPWTMSRRCAARATR